MGVCAGLRHLARLALIAFALLVFTPCAYADPFVLQRHRPTLNSLLPPVHHQPASVAAVPVEPICDIFANGYDALGATACVGCFDTRIRNRYRLRRHQLPQPLQSRTEVPCERRLCGGACLQRCEYLPVSGG